MKSFTTPLWSGLVAGVGTRERSAAQLPQTLGYTGSIAQALYWFGFQVANAVVYGARK